MKSNVIDELFVFCSGNIIDDFKILFEDKLWHKTGDLGYFDSSEQLWSA